MKKIEIDYNKTLSTYFTHAKEGSLTKDIISDFDVKSTAYLISLKKGNRLWAIIATAAFIASTTLNIIRLAS